MTEAIVQNIELNNMTNNVIQYPSYKKESDSSFSTLIDNAANKIEQTQTNFIDKVAKTNTSSINQFAIKSQKPQEQTQNNNINAQTKSQKQDNTNLDTDIKSTNSPQNRENVSYIENKTTVEQNIKKDNKTTINKVALEKNQTKIKSNIKDKNKDSINNDSLESSPISFSETDDNINIDFQNENTDKNHEDISENINKDIENIIQNILITFDVDINKEDKDSIDIKSIFENSNTNNEQNSEHIIKAIEEISSQIDNMNLSSEDKDKILLAFDKIKNELQKIDKNNIEFKNTIENINALADDIISKSENLIEIKTDSTDAEKISQSDTINPKTNNVEILKNDIENKDNVLSSKETIPSDSKVESVKENITELKDLAQNTDDKKDINIDTDVDTDENIVQKSQKTIQESQDISDDNKNIIKDETIKNEIKKNDIQNEDKTVSKLIDDYKNDKKIKQEEEIKTKLNSTNEDLISSEKENIQVDNRIEKIVSKLKEFEETQEYSKLSEKDKNEIEEAIGKLDLLSQKDKAIKNDNKEIIENLKKEVKNIISKEPENKDENIENSEIKIADINNSENSIETIKSFDDNISYSNNYSQNQNLNENTNQQSNQNNDNKQNNQTEFKISDNKQNNEINKNNTINEDLEENNQDDINYEISEENSEVKINENNQKLSASIVKEIREDFLENVEYTNDSPGALTVADEVVKMALDENQSLAQEKPIGSITYDPANSAVKIKNVQNLAQLPTKEISQSNVLNQIGDKLYQLKDSQKLTLVLRPNDLGRLSIELTSDKNGLTTNIIAQNEHVRSYIEKNINSLRSQLTEAGINVNTIQIKTAGQSNSSTYEGNQNKDFQQEQQNNNQQNQQRQQKNQKDRDEFANMQNYDMHFAKDFSSVLNKALSYMD